MKVIMVSNTAAYLRNMWLPLARALRDRGAEVIFLAPTDDEADALVRDRFRHEVLPLRRDAAHIVGDVKAFARILRFYRRERPAVVHHFTAKPILFGSLAAKLAGVPARLSTISGLGYLFAKEGWFGALVQRLMLRAYRVALDAPNSWVIFQNPHDHQLFLRCGVMREDRAFVIRSSGVDPSAFPFSPIPPGIPVVLCAARLLWDKGIGEFVAAARLLREQGVTARFVLAGWLDSEHPVAIPAGVIRAWHEEGVIEYVGYCHDIERLLRESTIVVLPSKYREGVPRILVEAALVGRPLVATNVPGCREVCVDGVNGKLVNPGDACALGAAIAELLADRPRAEELGRNGRRLAEATFNVASVVKETLRVYDAATAALPYGISYPMAEPSP